MQEEMIDVIDENGIKTGEILPRREVHKKGLWHRIIIVAIINENNEILIQQRSHKKDKNPDMWDISVAGHIISGQDSLQATIREINEEIGLDLSEETEIKKFRYIFSFRKEEFVNENHIDRQYSDFFILRKKGLNQNVLKLQEDEVQKTKFVSLSELNEMRVKKILVERDECYNELSNYLK
ncbi:MAG: NUDIX domain-containing protein [Clostridia bacterium]|nr:NUDIX domain-containing protein [Clostridia bacterium]